MSTQTLTLAQLRDDITALASAHPGCYPTNVIEVIHQCGEITVESENEEDALREELKNAEEATADAEKEAKAATERADKAEEEAQALREEMAALRDGEETVNTYRERTLAAEKQTESFRLYMVQAKRQVEDMERELKALRARKGVSAGVFKNIQKIRTLLATVARSAISKQHADEAAAILREIS